MDRPCMTLALLVGMLMPSGCANGASSGLGDGVATLAATSAAATPPQAANAAPASRDPRHSADIAMSGPAASDGVGLAPGFPPQLFGIWDLGPRPCRLPVNEDSDSPIRIEAGMLHGYEHFDMPVRIEQISDAPTAWRIVSTETYLGSQVTEQVRIFVLADDSLVVTDGTQARQYRKCE